MKRIIFILLVVGVLVGCKPQGWSRGYFVQPVGEGVLHVQIRYGSQDKVMEIFLEHHPNYKLVYTGYRARWYQYIAYPVDNSVEGDQ